MLTQVHDVSPTPTASLVEAALLETDEIKRLDPPYNVQLRSAGRQAWFASGDLRVAWELWNGVYTTSQNRYMREAAAREMNRIQAALASGRLGAARNHVSTPVVIVRPNP